MATADSIRNGSIDEIMTIRNKEFLIVPGKLITSAPSNNDTMELTEEQELMLKMSEDDIANVRTIPQNKNISMAERQKKPSVEWTHTAETQLFETLNYLDGKKPVNRLC